MMAARDRRSSTLALGFRLTNLMLGTGAILLMLDAHDEPGIVCVGLAASLRVLELRWHSTAKRA